MAVESPEIVFTIEVAPNMPPIPIPTAIATPQLIFPTNKPTAKKMSAIVAKALPVPPVMIEIMLHSTPLKGSDDRLAAFAGSATKIATNIMPEISEKIPPLPAILARIQLIAFSFVIKLLSAIMYFSKIEKMR